MNSCAAKGCHGAVDSTDPVRGRVYLKGGAFTTWLHYDPHARAFDVLLEPRSEAIARKLKGPLGAKPAHQAGLCLTCHATVGPPGVTATGSAPLADGVSCEACHGPAESWREKHLSTAWRAQALEVKALDGWVDLGSTAARARSCVPCHVGDRSRGMDVNHDLIAAGHPRLNFEFATAQAGYPKHWREAHEKRSPASTAASAEFEARSWAIGQVVTAKATVDLLAARAVASEEGFARRAPAPESAWPEFSEYECFACHHDLSSPSPRQVAGRSPGRLAWGTWATALLPEVAGAMSLEGLAPIEALRVEMTAASPSAARVAELSAQARGSLDALARSLESRIFDAAAINEIRNRLASTLPASGQGWDQATQRSLAIHSLSRASKRLSLEIEPAAEAVLRDGLEGLAFPPGYDSPRAAARPLQ